MNDGSLLLINEIDTLGKFYLHHGSIRDNPNTTPLRACMKCVRKDGEIHLRPGYLTYSKEFHPCPLVALNVQINDVEILESNNIVIARLVLFSKSLKEQRVLEINSNSRFPGAINQLVNLLNSYVNAGNDISLLNELMLNNHIGLRPINKQQLLSNINQISVIFFENSQSRVGKDNVFWSEIELSNLPENRYLTQAIVKLLSADNEFDNVHYRPEQNLIIVSFGHTNAYSPHTGRIECEVEPNQDQNIKDLMKLNLLKFFDTDLELYSRLKLEI